MADVDGSKYPTYSHLYGAYFRQDWMLDDPNPDDVVRRYMRVETVANREDLKTELRQLLDSEMSETQLKATLAPWDTFRPKDVEITIREWLERVLLIAETEDA